MTQTYTPDHLISGHMAPEALPIMLLEGEGALARGALLGLVSKAIAAPVAKTGNTGHGTCDTQTLGANAQVGTYTIQCITAVGGGGTFAVFDPFGRRLSDAVVGTAWAGEIGFEIHASGTDFIVGDSFTITVSKPAVEKYRWCHQSNVDGSQNPACVLAANTDSTSQDTPCPAYFHAELDPTAIVLQTGETMALYTDASRIKGTDIFLENIIPW